MKKNLTLKKVIAIHTFQVNIPSGKRIDLYNAAIELRKKIEVKYNPESGISGMHFHFQGKTYLLYANGSLCAYGNYTVQEKANTFNCFWRANKTFFLK